MKDIIASQRQTRRFSGSARLWLTFCFAGLSLALCPPMVFSTVAQLTEDLKITANFTPDRPVTPNTAIELRLNRKLKPDEGQLAIMIGTTDVTSLFALEKLLLRYNFKPWPLPLGE